MIGDEKTRSMKTNRINTWAGRDKNICQVGNQPSSRPLIMKRCLKTLFGER